MSLEHDERQRVLRTRFSSDSSQREFEHLRTDFHDVMGAVADALRTLGYDHVYDVAGSTSWDAMVLGMVHGKKVHVRVDIEEVLT